MQNNFSTVPKMIKTKKKIVESLADCDNMDEFMGMRICLDESPLCFTFLH